MITGVGRVVTKQHRSKCGRPGSCTCVGARQTGLFCYMIGLFCCMIGLFCYMYPDKCVAVVIAHRCETHLRFRCLDLQFRVVLGFWVHNLD